MIQTKGYATYDKDAKFVPFEFERREVGPNDILIDIEYAGICHSDIHTAKNEWEAMMPTVYPVVPGHEIVGRVLQVVMADRQVGVVADEDAEHRQRGAEEPLPEAREACGEQIRPAHRGPSGPWAR